MGKAQALRRRGGGINRVARTNGGRRFNFRNIAADHFGEYGQDCPFQSSLRFCSSPVKMFSCPFRIRKAEIAVSRDNQVIENGDCKHFAGRAQLLSHGDVLR